MSTSKIYNEDKVAAEEGAAFYDGSVIVIVGPTASGKTGAAIELAKRVGGEVISADSRAIYKYMDIGTAKPSCEEMEGVIHYGLDLVEPGTRFTVADFKEYTEQKIEEIRRRGKVPIVAGGTGLYVDALVYNYHFNRDVQKSYADRERMENGYVVLGIKWSTTELRERIMEREKRLFSEELFRETRFLVEKYGWGSQAMTSNIYQFAWKYLQNEITLEEAIKLAALDDYHLAKRQITWFKRNKEIIWVPLKEVVARAEDEVIVNKNR